MYCLKCGKKIPDNSKFCLKCGAGADIEKYVDTQSAVSDVRHSEQRLRVGGYARDKKILVTSLMIFIMSALSIIVLFATGAASSSLNISVNGVISKTATIVVSLIFTGINVLLGAGLLIAYSTALNPDGAASRMKTYLFSKIYLITQIVLCCIMGVITLFGTVMYAVGMTAIKNAAYGMGNVQGDAYLSVIPLIFCTLILTLAMCILSLINSAKLLKTAGDFKRVDNGKNIRIRVSSYSVVVYFIIGIISLVSGVGNLFVSPLAGLYYFPAGTGMIAFALWLNKVRGEENSLVIRQ